MAKKICPECGHENPEIAEVCEKCGHKLETDTHETMVTDLGADLYNAVLAGYGTDTFAGRKLVVIYIKGEKQPIIAEPTGEYVIGRSGGSQVINLDLGKYGAAKQGVSRRHAALHHDLDKGTLAIIDLDSRNGTFVNEQPVTPNVPFTLHDGDVIRLGKMVLHIYFK
nr:FHA domain-containing protein [Anaerolineae bacterium]